MERRDIESSPGESFLQQLKAYFSEYKKEWDMSGKMDWNCISRSEKHFRRHLIPPTYRDIYLKYIFCLLEEAECGDYSAIQTALENYVKYSISMHREHRRFYTVSLDELQTNQMFPSICTSVFLLPSFLSDLSAMRQLLRYGAHCTWLRIDKLEKIYMTDVISHLKSIGNVDPQNQKDFSKTERLVAELLMIYSTNDSKKRLAFFVVAIDVMTQKMLGDKYYLDSIESFRLLSKTTTQPLITVTEMERLLDKVYGAEENKEQKIRKFCNEFAEEFPKACQSLQPRTMKHLARCEIRKCLTFAGKLPHGVGGLGIPIYIENYILMQKQKDEFLSRMEQTPVPFP